MIESWVDFTLNVIGGATAFLCLFDGTRRLGSYLDRSGETKSFAPTQEDLLQRERVVAYYSRAEYGARSSLAEALLWLIMGVVAILFGFAMSFEKVPAPAGPTAEPDAPSSGTRH